MNRWEALVRIVEQLCASDRPGYALAAALLFATPIASMMGLALALWAR